jgi:hypothetical protein
MMKGEHATAAAEKPYQELVGNPPPAAAAGEQANQVIFGEGGGAANYREQAGKLVDKAAESGPDVDITPLKAEARRIIEKQITPPAEAFPRTAPLPEGEPDPKLMEDLAAGANMKVKDITKMWQEAQAAGPGSAKAKQFQQIQDAVGEFKRTTPEGQLAAAQAEGQKDLLKHPAMGVLGRIMNAEDTVPFSAAHLWKKELENTIRKTRDDAVRSQVANITQHLTGNLRQTLRAAGHEPYEAATAAYAKLVQPHVKGMVPKMRKLAVEEPEAVVRLLNPSQPTKAAMLVNLLTEQAAGGGGEAEGRQALEAVQAAWVHRKIIEGPGGLDRMGERLAKLPPEFRQAFLNDPKAQQVLDNLKLISTAYQTAVQESERGVTAAAAGGKAEIEAAKAAGKGGTEALGDLAAQREAAARATGRETAESARLTAEQLKTQTRQAGAKAVEASVQPIRPAREALVAGKQTAAEAQREFNESTLAQTTAKGTGMRTAVDLLRVGAAAAAGHPGAIISHSYWTTVSLARLLRGPSGADLVKWAAYSPAGTRLFVKAITSKTPALALADLARTSGILDQPETQPHVPIGRKPKGQVAAVGTPPPAVR